MKRSWAFFLTAVAATVIFICFFERLFNNDDSPSFYEGRSLHAIIQLNRIDRQNSSARVTGYHYDLLKKFASCVNAEIEIRPASLHSDPLDSLLLGAADIVVLEPSMVSANDSISFSNIIDSIAVWAVRSDDPRRHEELSAWMHGYIGSEMDDSVRSVFMTPLHPHRLAENGVRRSHITPYDEILKAKADSIGWDWRLLAALMYQESRFNINAGSPRGARGLMQLMPNIRRYYGCENYLDPEQNIMAGTRLLERLEDIFRARSANLAELEKFTLAAYNAGDSRISQCIEFAESKGADPSHWDSVAAHIPEFSMMSTIDSTMRTFNGNETISFVNKVLSYYDCFKAICPNED